MSAFFIITNVLINLLFHLMILISLLLLVLIGVKQINKSCILCFNLLQVNVIQGQEYLNEFKSQDDPMIIVSNHQTYLDVPLLMHLISNNDKKFVFVAKDLSFFKYFPKKLRSLEPFSSIRFVNANDLESIQRFIEKCTIDLQNKYSVVIFPEGKRSSHTTQTLPFMKGAFLLSVLTDTPVLPITHNLNSYLFSGGLSREISVKVQKPIKPCYIELLCSQCHTLMNDCFKDLPEPKFKLIHNINKNIFSCLEFLNIENIF